MVSQSLPAFEHYLRMMGSEDSLTRELGFQQLRSRTADFIDDIIKAFQHTPNQHVRRYLFILMVESRSPETTGLIQQTLDSQDEELLRTYAGLTGQYVVNNRVQLEPPQDNGPILGMRRKFGTIAGFPIYIHISLVIWLPLLLFGVLTIQTFTVLIVSIVIHEFAHAFTSRVLGLGSGTITVWFYGGVFIPTEHHNSLANMSFSQRLRYSAMIAAGPLSNLILAGVALLVSLQTLSAAFLRDIGLINLNLALLNLIPVPPLDGEKLISALLLRYFSRQQIGLGLGVLAVVGIVSICALTYQFDLRLGTAWFGILFWGAIYAFRLSRTSNETLAQQELRVVQSEQEFSRK